VTLFDLSCLRGGARLVEAFHLRNLIALLLLLKVALLPAGGDGGTLLFSKVLRHRDLTLRADLSWNLLADLLLSDITSLCGDNQT
jgi:hypothetical protein